MKVAIYSHTPIAGSPFLQYQCLKKYSNLELQHIQHRNEYKDGRVFPKDLLLSDRRATHWLRNADVVHLHNYLPSEIRIHLNPKRQRIIATLHSIPRQGNWQEVIKIAHKVFTIRQPMQQREYKGFPTLPNMFDVWGVPVPKKVYTNVINIVYCPTNKHPNSAPGSKGYLTVMPFLEALKKERKNDVNIISHSNMEYYKNLAIKQEGHITIDDICGATFHLTSLEACSTQQTVLTSCPKDWGFPFVYTTLSNLREKVEYLLDNRDMLERISKESRAWMEKNWNPVDQVKEYIKAYGS